MSQNKKEEVRDMIRFTCTTLSSTDAGVYRAPSGREYTFHKRQYALIPKKFPEDIEFFDKSDMFERHPEDKKIKIKKPKKITSLSENAINEYLNQNGRTVIKSLNSDNLDKKSLQKLLKAEETGRKRRLVLTYLKKLLKR